MPKPLSDQHERLAQARALGHKPNEAARLAGYKGSGKTFAANARKACNRSDVKARVAELRAPALEKVKEQIEINIEWANQKLATMANHELNADEIKATDQIAALRLLAQIHGWLAPEKIEHSLNGLGDRLDRAIARAKEAG
jgi:hypothetical protein